MNINYYLKQDSDSNLYCQISEKNASINFSMECKIDPELWNSENDKVADSDPYVFALQDFKRYLSVRYFELIKEGKENALSILMGEARDLLKNEGIEGASRRIFNKENTKYGIPPYDAYLKAFEEYTGLKREKYKVEILDFEFHFHTEKGIYEMDTYEGRIALYKNLIKRRAYFDLITLSDADKWSEIYENIPKKEFIPAMQKEIEYCLKENFARTGIHLEKDGNFEEKRKKLLKQFKIFIDRYESGNAIDLACEIDEDILYPIVVITMTNIYDLDACCEEYCELEFQDEEEPWKVIFLNDNEEDLEDKSLAFYIRPYR
ncbi:hypothetical protein [Chryseobacterium indologenes]|uniref:hypothetical protein n=1 Tax=Chryseobacterium indologenes TaxID=253 RepID=UPI0030192215